MVHHRYILFGQRYRHAQQSVGVELALVVVVELLGVACTVASAAAEEEEEALAAMPLGPDQGAAVRPPLSHLP